MNSALLFSVGGVAKTDAPANAMVNKWTQRELLAADKHCFKLFYSPSVAHGRREHSSSTSSDPESPANYMKAI